MKKFRYILMLLVMVGFAACDSDSIEGLKGEFSDVTFCNFNSASVQPTEKLGKGIKALNTQFTDAAGNMDSWRGNLSVGIRGKRCRHIRRYSERCCHQRG